MQDRHGKAGKGGVPDLGDDPEAFIAEVKRRDTRSEGIKNLIQAVILLGFGAVLHFMILKMGGISLWVVLMIIVGFTRLTQGIAMVRASSRSSRA